MINYNSPVVEHSTPIAIINQAFAIFQSNVVTDSGALLVTYDGKTYSLEVHFGNHLFAITLNGETKTIIQEGMYVDFYEVANDIERWFESRVIAPENLDKLMNYDIHNFILNMYEDSGLVFINDRNLNQLVVFKEDAINPVVFLIQQDYTGYHIYHESCQKLFHIGYQMLTGEVESHSVRVWLDEQLK
jgi:hypothetical protein